jgi:CRP-like cAMP-binding protein
MNGPVNVAENLARTAAARRSSTGVPEGPKLGRTDARGSIAGASRWATLNGFVDVKMADLTRAELAVWLVLYRDTRDGTARAGVADIARRAGCHRGSVVRAVQSLKARGLIRVVKRGRKNGGTSVYEVCGVPSPMTSSHRPR